ncbi:unnamed protein product, partial [Iphiclides podalirius]
MSDPLRKLSKDQRELIGSPFATPRTVAPSELLYFFSAPEIRLPVWIMSEERSRRLSQIFDPLSRFTDAGGAGRSASTPNSPRLLPRRSRGPPPPPPRPLGHASHLDPLDYELAAAEFGAVNWQERCLELQLELHRSRHQATRVRDMLRDKFRNGTEIRFVLKPGRNMSELFVSPPLSVSSSSRVLFIVSFISGARGRDV